MDAVWLIFGRPVYPGDGRNDRQARAGPGLRKNFIGGNHSRIEGGYILYHPQTEFYYMFLSFGGLDANGGYNIRVARSERPDGPYYDAAGNAMLDVKADPSKPLFDDGAIEPYGVELMGNYLFERKVGDPGTASARATCRPAIIRRITIRPQASNF